MKLLLPLIPLLFLVSCMGPKHTYKNFYSSTDKLSRVAVGSDGTVLEDKSMQKADAFIKGESQEVARQMHYIANSILQKKGYAPTAKAFTSTALSLPNEITAFAVDHRSQDSGSFFVKPYSFTARNKSKTKLYAAQKLSQRLLNTNLLSSSAKQEYFSELGDLGVRTDEYLLVVTGLSRNVHAGKQVAQMIGTAILSFGTIVMSEPDIGYVSAALIDPRTKKIVWANQAACNSNKTDVMEAVSGVLEELPARQ